MKKNLITSRQDLCTCTYMGAQWLSGRVLDWRPRSRRFEPHRRHCVVSLSKNINPSLVLVQPRKTRPFITERLLMGRKESNQTNLEFLSTSLKSSEPTHVKILHCWKSHVTAHNHMYLLVFQNKFHILVGKGYQVCTK